MGDSISAPNRQVQEVESGMSMQVGSVPIPGVYRIRETGGETAPNQQTEKGYSYSTRVGPEPRTLVVEAKVDASTLTQLKTLRSRGEPFTTSVKTTTITACKLNDLKIIEQGQTPNSYDVSITIEEIQQATTGTTQIQVQGVTGTKNGSSGSNNSASGGNNSASESQADPHVAQSKNEQKSENNSDNENSGLFANLMEGFNDAFSGGNDQNNQSN